MEKLPQFLLNIIDSIIILVFLFVFAAIPLFSIRRLGRAAVMAAIGFVLLMIATLLDIAFSAWAVFAYDYTSSRDYYETIYWAKTAVRVPVTVIGFVLLVAAILAKRPGSDETTI